MSGTSDTFLFIRNLNVIKIKLCIAILATD